MIKRRAFVRCELTSQVSKAIRAEYTMCIYNIYIYICVCVCLLSFCPENQDDNLKIKTPTFYTFLQVMRA